MRQVSLTSPRCRLLLGRNVWHEQKDVEMRAKASTIEAKIQSFIPGKMIIVSRLRVVQRTSTVFRRRQGVLGSSRAGLVALAVR